MKLRDFNYQQKSQGQTYPWMALPDIYRGINSNVLRQFHKNISQHVLQSPCYSGTKTRHRESKQASMGTAAPCQT